MSVRSTVRHFICLTAQLSHHSLIRLSLHPSILPSVIWTSHLSAHSARPYICKSICLLVHPFVRPTPIHRTDRSPVRSPVSPSVLLIHPSFRPLVHLSVRPPAHTSARLFIHPSTRPSVRLLLNPFAQTYNLEACE